MLQGILAKVPGERARASCFGTVVTVRLPHKSTHFSSTSYMLVNVSYKALV